MKMRKSEIDLSRNSSFVAMMAKLHTRIKIMPAGDREGRVFLETRVVS